MPWMLHQMPGWDSVPIPHSHHPAVRGRGSVLRLRTWGAVGHRHHSPELLRGGAEPRGCTGCIHHVSSKGSDWLVSVEENTVDPKELAICMPTEGSPLINHTLFDIVHRISASCGDFLKACQKPDTFLRTKCNRALLCTFSVVIYSFPRIDIIKYVIYGIASAFFVYGILLMVEGFFTSGAIKDLYGDFKITTCGRCVSAWVGKTFQWFLTVKFSSELDAAILSIYW